MKKALAFLLATMLLLSLTACGNNSESNALEIHSSATSGDWSFTLTDIEFADTLSTDPNYNSPYYLRPTDDNYSGSWYTPDTGNVYLFFTALLSYSGKETAEIGTWGDNYLGFTIRYGDGYTFDTYEFVIDDGQEFYFPQVTFEPLSSARQCKGYFEVPIELQNSTENILELVVNMPSGSGRNTDFVYDLR